MFTPVIISAFRLTTLSPMMKCHMCAFFVILYSVNIILFQFGGKLVCFENSKPGNPQQADERLVYISQVVTETELVSRSNQLEQALSKGQYNEFCSLKIANSQDELEQHIWNFLKVKQQIRSGAWSADPFNMSLLISIIIM